jgi:aminoglycoside/choline kinase family phosphotransferase
VKEDLQPFVKAHFLESWGELPQHWQPLEADGSARRFFRVHAGQRSLVVLSHPDGRATGENDAYVAIGRHLHRRGIPVPAIRAYHRSHGWIIVEDLGDRNLHQAVSKSSNLQEILSLYGPVLDALLTLQIRGARGFRETWCYQGARYDFRLMMEGESGHFLRSFLQGYLGWSGPEAPLHQEFEALAGMASSAPSDFLIHRDFQSRNVLLPSLDSPHLIDFQGARWGPLQYDVAALVIDPYVHLSDALRGTVLAAYLERLEASGLMHPEEFMGHYPLIALHRNLQILGAFAFLGCIKMKPFFLQYIPSAVSRLNNLLGENPHWDCPHLRESVAQAWDSLLERRQQKSTNDGGRYGK